CARDVYGRGFDFW
nr:immunoglobulin heavy chain junction region [Macaca mulatta]